MPMDDLCLISCYHSNSSSNQSIEPTTTAYQSLSTTLLSPIWLVYMGLAIGLCLLPCNNSRAGPSHPMVLPHLALSQAIICHLHKVTAVCSSKTAGRSLMCDHPSQRTMYERPLIATVYHLKVELSRIKRLVHLMATSLVENLWTTAAINRGINLLRRSLLVICL
jgi:hypothetical protein